jgi:hypothetical protein
MFNNLGACKHGQTFGGIEQQVSRETPCNPGFPLRYYATSGDIAKHGETPDFVAPMLPQDFLGNGTGERT